MTTYETMSFHLETERLILRPWAESDAAEFCELLAERGKGTHAVTLPQTSVVNMHGSHASCRDARPARAVGSGLPYAVPGVTRPVS